MNVLIPLAEGFEEIEAVVVIDVLRRAGITVTTAATANERNVTASRGVVLVADALWHDIDTANYDAIILPGGGPGTKRLAANKSVCETVAAFNAQGKIVAAICAAPIVLAAAGILGGRAVTCYPSCETVLTGARYTAKEAVVIDGNVITSQGPGTSFAFSLALVERLTDKETAAKVAQDLLYKPCSEIVS